LFDAAKEFDIDLKNSILIGDKERDIDAALNAGLIETYLYDENGITSNSKAKKIVNKLEKIWK
jgi:D-glycero-D-manno-heptose 1,7-bisphosphate phosphatase